MKKFMNFEKNNLPINSFENIFEFLKINILKKL